MFVIDLSREKKNQPTTNLRLWLLVEYILFNATLVCMVFIIMFSFLKQDQLTEKIHYTLGTGCVSSLLSHDYAASPLQDITL